MKENSVRARYCLGPYEIESTTGTGGTAVVYRAVDHALGRRVALKVLRDDLRAQPHIVARFRREAETSARLRHPHIVPIFTVGEWSGIPYIAMAHIDGESLETYLRGRGPIPWTEALDIGLQVAGALACAHAAQIIHRDIKPANILLDKQGKAYVTDFGIAKVLNAEVQLTLEGMRLGTPLYLCPERCQNKVITPSSDLYSLGVVLFQSITGSLPHQAPSMAELMLKIAGTPAARIRDFVPEIPDSVDRLVAHMLELKPENRPKSAQALCEAIERVRNGEALDLRAEERAGAIAAYRQSLGDTPVKSDRHPTPKTGSPRRRRLRGKPAALAGALAAALCIAGGALFSTQLLPDAKLETPASIERWSVSSPALELTAADPDGLRKIDLNLPDFRIVKGSWGGPEAGFLMQFEGRPGTIWQRHYAACAINPSAEPGTLVVPPTTTSFTLLPGGTKAIEPGCWISTGRETLRKTWTGGELVAECGMPVSHLARAWHTDRFAAAYPQEGGTGWILAEGSEATGAPLAVRAQVSAPVTQMACDSAGRWLAYVLQTSGTVKELRVASMTEADWTGNPLLTGDIELGDAPMRSDGHSLALNRRLGDDTPSLLLMDMDARAVEAELGAGRSPSWHPSGHYLVAAAEDAQGSLQLWAIKASVPYARTQLTHLEGGVDGRVVLSETDPTALLIRSVDELPAILRLPDDPFSGK